MEKQLIKISVKAGKTDVVKAKGDVLAVGVFDDGKLAGDAMSLDKALGGWMGKIIKIGDFKGKAKTDYCVYGDGRIGAKRVLMVGLGAKDKADTDCIRKAAEQAAAKTVSLEGSSLVCAFFNCGKKFDVKKASQAVAEGAFLGGYKYDEFMTDKENKRPGRLSVTVANGDNSATNKGATIGLGQQLARTLVVRPANIMYPSQLAAEARKMAKSVAGLTCRVMTEKQLADKKMGGILAVGGGSAKPPRLIELKYSPAKIKKDTPHIALIGKAITFDSGGISIKPSANMQDMKMDMGGGGAVIGAMQAIARLKLPVKVTGIVCSAENMPDGTSYRPGDIVKTYSGKTVEIQNTDAEGRMCLCDGIYYAKKDLKADIIIDAATLTGACVVALGKYKAGLMSNDDGLVKQLMSASVASGEALWHLPCGDEYTQEMKSEIADLKNIGSRWGGACTAGSFLREFAGEEVKWAHLDIAGPGMYDPAVKSGSGSRGFAVRVFTEFVAQTAEK